MKTSEEVRNSVSRAYAAALQAPTPGGCCGGGNKKSVITDLAGYSREDLATVPPEARDSAFGCGNPTAFAHLKPGETVLDLGSGAGIDLILAASQVGPKGKVIGVDMTDEMLARAAQALQKAGVQNAELRKGIIEDLPVDSGTIDHVISNCVINLSPEKPKVFQEIARVLKPGGRLAISDIMAEDLPAWLQTSEAYHSACLAGAIPEPDYIRGLEAAGLIDVRVTGRQVYDADQLGVFLAEDKVAGATSCCGGTLPPDIANILAHDLAGKVWSARVEARKPA
jgi:SAM-dependent methyltransferase